MNFRIYFIGLSNYLIRHNYTVLLCSMFLILTGCSAIWITDFAGIGAKTKCFYLDTDSLFIHYTCDQRKIFSIDILEMDSLFEKRINTKDFANIFDDSAKKFLTITNVDSVTQVVPKYINSSGKYTYAVYNYFKKELNPKVAKFYLPVNKELFNKKRFSIELHVTDTHWRETYYFYYGPEKIKKGDAKIYARYFSH